MSLEKNLQVILRVTDYKVHILTNVLRNPFRYYIWCGHIWGGVASVLKRSCFGLDRTNTEPTPEQHRTNPNLSYTEIRLHQKFCYYSVFTMFFVLRFFPNSGLHKLYFVPFHLFFFVRVYFQEFYNRNLHVAEGYCIWRSHVPPPCLPDHMN